VKLAVRRSVLPPGVGRCVNTGAALVFVVMPYPELLLGITPPLFIFYYTLQFHPEWDWAWFLKVAAGELPYAFEKSDAQAK